VADVNPEEELAQASLRFFDEAGGSIEAMLDLLAAAAGGVLDDETNEDAIRRLFVASFTVATALNANQKEPDPELSNKLARDAVRLEEWKRRRRTDPSAPIPRFEAPLPGTH